MRSKTSSWEAGSLLAAAPCCGADDEGHESARRRLRFHACRSSGPLAPCRESQHAQHGSGYVLCSLADTKPGLPAGCGALGGGTQGRRGTRATHVRPAGAGACGRGRPSRSPRRRQPRAPRTGTPARASPGRRRRAPTPAWEKRRRRRARQRGPAAPAPRRCRVQGRRRGRNRALGRRPRRSPARARAARRPTALRRARRRARRRGFQQGVERSRAARPRPRAAWPGRRHTGCSGRRGRCAPAAPRRPGAQTG